MFFCLIYEIANYETKQISETERGDKTKILLVEALASERKRWKSEHAFSL